MNDMTTNTRSRTLNRLSAVRVDSAGPGIHSDGGGLILRVDDKGGRKWVFRFTSPVTGKRRDMGLGRAGKGFVPLADARQAAADARAMIGRGLDPMDEAERERQAKAAEAARGAPRTFGQFADEWLDQNEGQFASGKHVKELRVTFTRHAAALRDKLPAGITTEDMLRTLRPIWRDRPATGKRVQQRIERVMDAARAAGLYAGENPARWRNHLDTLLPTRSRKDMGHHASLPYDRLPVFMAALRQEGGIAALALELIVLTAARSGEVRGMAWSEVDLDAARWTIPGARMKSAREHRVPLSGRALEILTEMQGYRRKADNGMLVFPGAERLGRPRKSGYTGPVQIKDMTVAVVITRLHDADTEVGGKGFIDPRQGRVATVHGFRSTFRDWAEDVARFPAGAIRAALAHAAADGVDAHYRRGDGYDVRAELMSVWERFLASADSVDKVVPIRGRGA